MTIIQALELMKTHVVTIRDDCSLADAIDRMDLYQVDELPVINSDGELCGSVNEADIASELATILSSQAAVVCPGTTVVQDISRVKVRETMSHTVSAIHETVEVTQEMVHSMLISQRRVPVVDSENKVVGSLNRVDIIQALFEGTLLFD